MKSDKAEEKDSPGQQRIAYKRRKTVSKEKKNTSKKCENVGISLESSTSAVGNNRSVLTPPTSMRRLTQQRSLLKRDSLLITSCTAEGHTSHISEAPVKLDACLEPDVQPANVQHISENAEETPVTMPNAVANDLINSNQVYAHQKPHDLDSDQISQPQFDSVVGVDEAMLIMSDSNASAVMDWCPNKTLEPPVAEVLNGPCILESTNQSMISLEHSNLEAGVRVGANTVDIARESMEISDTSLMLDTQTLKMITDATNADRYLSKVQNQVVVTNDVNQVSSGIKEVPYTLTVDTPLLFSEADGDLDVCQFASSFLTQMPVNVSTSVYNKLEERGIAQPQIYSAAGNVMDLRSVGNDMNTGCDTNEQHVEPTFTNLVPLSNYERERCSGGGRFSDVLFENEDSQGDDTVLRNSAEVFLQTANNGKVLTRRKGSLTVDKAASSDDSIFANSDACHSADNSNNLHVETVAEIRLHENIETFKNLEIAMGKTRAFITDSLTTSMIAKVLADGEMQMSDQNESLFGNDDCPVVVESVTKLNENVKKQQIAKGSEQVQMNRFKHDIQDNVQLDHAEKVRHLASLNQKVQNLSPEMESIMSGLFGTQTRRLPKRSSKRSKSSLNLKNNKSNCNVEKETKRIRQSNSILDEQIDAKESNCEIERKHSKEDVNQMNSISSGSDSSTCIPPTPPSLAEDASKTSTPKRLLGGVVGTPKKPGSMPTLAIKLGEVDSNGGCNIDRDGTRALQQSCYTGDDSRLISMTQSFTVIDVASNRLLFENFIKEWRCRKSFSLSLACERYVTPQRSRSNAIGSKFTAGVCEMKLV